MRFRLVKLFLITAIAGFVIHCVQCRLLDQPVERLLGALLVFYTGTLTTILMSVMGSAIGGRMGSITGAGVAVVAGTPGGHRRPELDAHGGRVRRGWIARRRVPARPLLDPDVRAEVGSLSPDGFRGKA